MKLIEQLIGRAKAADGAMGELAAQGARSEQRKQATRALERQLDRMMSDGVLSQDEVKELMLAYRAEGLDTSTLEALAREMSNMDGVVGVRVDGDDRSQLLDELQRAGDALDDPFFEFKAQQLMSTHGQAVQLASRVSKAEHEMYMSAIRNLKA